MMIKKTKLTFKYLPATVIKFAIFISILSQIEPLEHILRPAMYIIWAVIIAWGIIRKRLFIHLSLFNAVFAISYILFLLLYLSTIIWDNRQAPNYLRILLIPLLVSITGDLYRDVLFNYKTIYSLCFVYFISALVYVAWVNLTYFTSYTSWLNSRVYVFPRKNSAGQIWCSAFLIAIFILYPNSKKKVLLCLGSLYLLVMTGIVQCRASLFGIAFALFLYSIYKSKTKIRLIILYVFVFGILLSVPFTRAFLRQALFMNKHAGMELNAFSSGRIMYYQIALSEFSLSPVIGVGQYYVDLSYLSVLTESGIIGFILVEPVWVWKFISCVKKKKNKLQFSSFLFVIAVFYMVESLLEAYPPFGPGVSSLMFWLLSGVLINNKELVIGQSKTDESLVLN